MIRRPLNPLAGELNGILSRDGCVAASLLSERGLRAYFPHHGILGQGVDAKSCAINATLGTAKEDDGSPLRLQCLSDLLAIPDASFLYAPSFGVPELRKYWEAAQLRKNPSLAGIPHSLPVVTNALTHALFMAAQMVVGRSEKVIIPNYFWDNYDLIFTEAFGATFDTFQTFSRGRFNVAGLRRKLLGRGEKKIVVLNVPNNPTGYTPTEQEADAIQAAFLEAARAGKRIAAIIDDAYFGLVYEKGVFRESIFTRLAALHENILAIKLDGATKEDYVWGFRIGFITFGMKGMDAAQFKALEDKAGGLVRSTISSSSNIAQRLLLAAYGDARYEEEKREKHATLETRYRTVKAILRQHREFRESFVAMPFNSGYFMCVKPIGVDPEALRSLLVKKYSTGTIMLDGLIRVAFSSVPTGKLETLFLNIDAAIRELREDGK